MQPNNVPALTDPPPLVGRDAVLYVGKDGLMRVALGEETPAPQPWLFADDLGEPTAPLVLLDGRVYTGTRTRGLVQLGKN